MAAGLLALLFGTLLVSSVPLLDHDEGRHASIALEMVERGDYLTPSLLGKPFFDKPACFFWLQAAALQLFGIHAAAVRLPGLLCGLAGCLASGWGAGRLFGPTAGLLATLFHATMILPLAAAQAAVHDVALVPCVTVAVIALWEAERPTRSHWKWVILAGMALGAALLLKGLLGIAFAGLAHGTLLLLERRLTRSACIRGGLALGLGLLLAAPWYVAMGLAHPGYFAYYFLERHLQGFATDSQRHGDRPVWYYLPLLVIGGLPWIAYLPAGWRNAWITGTFRGQARSDSGRRLLWVWGGGSLLFLSAAGSKLPSYLLPVFPAVALLAADVWNRLLSDELDAGPRRWMNSGFWGTATLAPVLLPITLFVVHELFGWPLSPIAATLATLISLGGVLPLVWWHRRLFLRAALGGAGVMTACFVFLTLFVLPDVARQFTARELADHFNRHAARPLRAWLLEERVGSVVFYLRPELRDGLQAEQFRRVSLSEVHAWKHIPPDVWLVVTDSEFEEAAQTLLFPDSPQARAGRFRIYPGAAVRVREQSLPSTATGEGPG